jgi:hypothetical protein
MIPLTTHPGREFWDIFGTIHTSSILFIISRHGGIYVKERSSRSYLVAHIYSLVFLQKVANKQPRGNGQRFPWGRRRFIKIRWCMVNVDEQLFFSP